MAGLIGFRNGVDSLSAITVTGDGTTEMPASNMQTRQLGQRFTRVGLSTFDTVTLSVTVPESSRIDSMCWANLFAVLGVRMSGVVGGERIYRQVTVQVKAKHYDTDPAYAWESSPVIAGTDGEYEFANQSLAAFFTREPDPLFLGGGASSVEAMRYYEIEFTDLWGGAFTAATGILEVGRLWIGNALAVPEGVNARLSQAGTPVGGPRTLPRSQPGDAPRADVPVVRQHDRLGQSPGRAAVRPRPGARPGHPRHQHRPAARFRALPEIRRLLGTAHLHDRPARPAI